LVNTSIRYHGSGETPIKITFRVANPGETPIQIRFATVKILPQSTRSFKLVVPDYIPAGAMEDIEAFIPKETFPEADEHSSPQWKDVHFALSYISGKKYGERDFGRVARIARMKEDVLMSLDYYEIRQIQQRKRREWATRLRRRLALPGRRAKETSTRKEKL
jgi:hypothetical protein